MNKKICFAFDYIFPNFILPNALNPELGVLNYTASRYNNDVNYGTYTENYYETLNKFFGESAGGKQNSLYGYFFEADAYKGKIEYEYDSIFSAIKNDKKFIYIIKPNPNFFDLCGTFNYDELKDEVSITGNQFWKFISKRALDAIKTKKGIILIDYSLEPMLLKLHYKALNESLKFSGIDKNSIYIAVNAFNSKELYEKEVNEEDRKFNVLNVGFCLEHSSHYYQSSINLNHDLTMTNDKFIETKNVIRKNYFLMKINGPKLQRLKILIKMIDNDLTNLGDWSFSGERGISSSMDFKQAIKDEEIKDIIKIENVLDNGPYKLESERNIPGGVSYDWFYSKNYLPNMNSYFEICFESIFYEDRGVLTLTEKVFKPIVNFQPFLLIAPKGTLNLLKNLGFKTFEPFIDESYDNEENNNKRLLMIYDEIKKLCTLTKEEIHDWYWKMEDTLVHNHNHLLSIHKNRMITEDTIDFLKNKLYE